MKSLLFEIAKGRVLVSDGAWGTLLHQRGLEPGECPESWNLSRPADVRAVAAGYVEAGADIILTNSFGGSPSKLAHYGLADQTAAFNEAAAAISRQAAGPERLVLGSIGPTGVILMMGEVSEDELYQGFAVQAAALAKGGVDGFCIETMSAIDEACLAIRAAREATGLEVACTFTFEKTVNGDYRTMMGVSPAEMVAALKEAGASVIGTNCGNGIDGMIEIVRQIRAVEADMPILVHANAGKPILRDGVTVFPETPEVMSAKSLALAEAGASVIGGCCGTTPAHIAALGQKLRCVS